MHELEKENLAQQQKYEKVIISEEVEFDDCKNDEGKMSVWKCFKKFWSPKSWFDYKSYCSRENFWYTFLGNIMYPFLGAILFAILVGPLFKLGGVGGATIAVVLGILILGYWIVGGTLSSIAMLYRRANSAGIKKTITTLGYTTPVALGIFFSLGTIATDKLSTSHSVFQSLSGFAQLISIITFVVIGVLENKFLAKKIVKKTVLIERVKGDNTNTIINEEIDKEFVFFDDENNKK